MNLLWFFYFLFLCIETIKSFLIKNKREFLSGKKKVERESCKWMWERRDKNENTNYVVEN
jgi:hypothetical protein